MSQQTECVQPPEDPKGLLQRLLQIRAENLVDITTYVLLISLMVVFVLTHRGDYDIKFFATILAFSGVLVLNLIRPQILRLFASEERGYWFFLVACAVFSLTGIGLGETIEIVYILFMIAAQAVMMVPFRPALVFIIALAALFLLLFARLGFGLEGMLSLVVSMLIGLVFVVTVSRMAVLYMRQTERTRALLAELQESNRQLESAREKEMALAIAEERIRMAREIHDGLGHHLTVLSIQLQAADKLIGSQPDKAAEAIQTSRGEVQEALSEVRRSVAAMRAAAVTAQTLPEALSAMVRDFGRNSDMDAVFEQAGDLVGLSEGAAQSLYRAVQEGLTNARKHARGASKVTVRLTGVAGGAALRLQDDGAGGDCTGTGGFGLAGIRERVYQLNGRFECGSDPAGGFFLDIFLPAEKEAG